MSGEEPALGGQPTDDTPGLGEESIIAHLVDLLGSEDDTVRGEAALRLAEIGDKRAAASLATLLAPRTSQRVPRLLHALAHFPDLQYATMVTRTLQRNINRPAASRFLLALGPEAIPAMLDAFNEPVPYWRSMQRNMARVLAQMGTSAVEPLITALWDERLWAVLTAALALGDIQDERAVGPLIERLQANHIETHSVWPERVIRSPTHAEQVQSSLLYALATFYDQRVVPAVIPFLQAEHSWVRHAAITALKRPGNTEAFEAVAPFVHHEHRATNQQALEALAIIDPARMVPFVLEECYSDDRYYRDRSRLLLKKSGPAAVEPILAALDDIPEPHRLVDVLGDIGDKRAVPKLLTLLQHDSSHLRRAAAVALGKLNAVEAAPALIEALRRGDLSAAPEALARMGILSAVPDLIAAAEEHPHAAGLLRALGILADPQALPLLLDRAKDANTQTRIIALEALPNFTDIRTLEPLLAALRDEDPLVQLHVWLAMFHTPICHPEILDAITAYTDPDGRARARSPNWLEAIYPLREENDD